MSSKKKLIRITTIPLSLEKLLENQLSFMSQYYEVTAIASDEKRLKEFGDRERVNTFSVALTRQITPIKDVIALWKLFWYFRKEKPFIVHSHTPKAGIIAMLASKFAGVPNRLHTVAGLPLLEKKGGIRRILNFVEKVTYSCSTKVYPNSNGLQKIILKEGFCSPEKLKVLGNGSSNGIDIDYFNPENFLEEKQVIKSSFNIAQNDFVFIFVGRLVGDKGINELVNAFKRLSANKSNLKLLLVGSFEPTLDPLTVETLKEIESNEHIKRYGFQLDVRPYLFISDVLVFPSYREGFPNVVLQAGLMGLPSIVSNINGCNEIIIENENGTIIPVKDACAIYDAMLNFVEKKDLVVKLKSNARRMIVERYEQKVVWEAILAEYRRLENV